MDKLGKLVDRKTGRQLHSGDWLLRKDYKGFTRHYELLSLNETNTRVQVRELDGEDRWLYHSFPLTKLGLDWVIL